MNREIQDNLSPTEELSFTWTPNAGQFPNPEVVEEGLIKATLHAEGFPWWS